MAWIEFQQKYSKFKKYTTWSSFFFFAKFIFMERKRPPMVIFQLDVLHNWPNKLPQKSMDEKLSSFLLSRPVFVIHKPQNGTSGVVGFKQAHGKLWFVALWLHYPIMNEVSLVKMLHPPIRIDCCHGDLK
jgi:hypothetical protein